MENSKGLIKDRSFYKKMLGIAVPIALQNMISTCAGIVDTLMVGKLGDIAVSGVSLGNNPAFLIQMVGFGFSTGGIVLISQYWGKNNREVVPRIMGISIRFMLLFTALFTAVCALFPEAVMRVFTDEQAVIISGSRYISTVCWGYIPMVLVAGYIMSLRGVGKTMFSLVLYGSSTVVNVFFNYCLIFGRLGFPQLGAVGAAWATVISRVFELVLVTIYMYAVDKTIMFRWSDLFRFEKVIIKDYLKYSLPVVGNETAWCLGSIATSAIIGHLGSAATAANSVSNVLQQIALVAIFGIGNASSVLIGNAVGAKEYGKAKKIGNTMMLVAAGAGVAGAAIIILLRGVAINFYEISDTAKQLANQLMMIMACTMVFAAMEITMISGILRGSGDTRFAFLVDAGAMWLIGVPCGFLAAFVFELPIWMVFLFIRFDMPVKFFICLPRILRGRYVRDVTRDGV